MNWLADESFPDYYVKLVDALALSLAVHVEVDIERLDGAHLAWGRDLKRELDSKTLEERNIRFAEIILGRLGFRLWRACCVRFTDKAGNGIDIRYTEHRKLLLEYPNEYSALEVIRAAHMDIYFSDPNPNVRRLRIPALRILPAVKLREAFQRIRDHPTEFSDYVKLLELPEHSNE